jgi:hypothetical protein
VALGDAGVREEVAGDQLVREEPLLSTRL